MSSVVLDSSAVLALVCRETGAEQVSRHLPEALISAVNLAEVFSKAKDKDVSLESLVWMVRRLQLQIVPFDAEAAKIVGSLRESTRDAGLSLGDRACLALGLSRACPVITGDKRWLEAVVGVEVELIR